MIKKCALAVFLLTTSSAQAAISEHELRFESSEVACPRHAKLCRHYIGQAKLRLGAVDWYWRQGSVTDSVQQLDELLDILHNLRRSYPGVWDVRRKRIYYVPTSTRQ